MNRDLQLVRVQGPQQRLRPCEHRTVASDGRVVCSKIVLGEAEVSPELCRACPGCAVNCVHLRFSLRQTSPSPLIVRYNGRTEIWNDDPAELSFERAACAARVMPIETPRICAACASRQPQMALAAAPAHPVQRCGSQGKVVPFVQPQVVAATG